MIISAAMAMMSRSSIFTASFSVVTMASAPAVRAAALIDAIVGGRVAMMVAEAPCSDDVEPVLAQRRRRTVRCRPVRRRRRRGVPVNSSGTARRRRR